MTTGSDITAPDPATSNRSGLDRLRTRMGRCCVAALAIATGLSGIAWLLPLRAAADSPVYEVLFAVAFVSRVFLLPVAASFLALSVLAFACRRRSRADGGRP